LPANVRPGWKSLLGKNTLAYLENPQIMDVKSFITFGPGWKNDLTIAPIRLEK